MTSTPLFSAEMLIRVSAFGTGQVLIGFIAQNLKDSSETFLGRTIS